VDRWRPHNPGHGARHSELVERWKRELARAAQLPAWEPGPSAVSSNDTEEPTTEGDDAA
jgi:hypothetical protein